MKLWDWGKDVVGFDCTLISNSKLIEFSEEVGRHIKVIDNEIQISNWDWENSCKVLDEVTISEVNFVAINQHVDIEEIFYRKSINSG